MATGKKDLDARQKILDAATEIFKRDGIEKASMRKIAQEAGYTTGAIYALFAGKEDLYATLLADSLDRLHTALAMASAHESDNVEALITVTRTFYEYYANNPFEANMGIYLYGMGQVRSMGRERDTVLNEKLLQSLNIFSTCLFRLIPDGFNDEESQQWVTNERDLIFTTLLGIATLRQSGRAKSINTTPDTVFDYFVTTLYAKYSK